MRDNLLQRCGVAGGRWSELACCEAGVIAAGSSEEMTVATEDFSAQDIVSKVRAHKEL